MTKDELEIIEQGQEEVNKKIQLEVDWSSAEHDDINLRTRSILDCTKK